MDNVHLNVKYPCDQCEKVFRSDMARIKHVRRIHVPESEKRFPCPFEGCVKSFIDKRALSCHEMNVHIKARPYSCR